MSIHETIYNNLDKLGVIQLVKKGVDNCKSKSDPYMDLSFDCLNNSDDFCVIALAHNYIQGGDVCADPDMEIKIHWKTGEAEALNFSMSMPPVFDVVYPSPDVCDARMKKKLNGFLNTWLQNCINQGHQFKN